MIERTLANLHRAVALLTFLLNFKASVAGQVVSTNAQWLKRATKTPEKKHFLIVGKNKIGGLTHALST